jgi:hypothetical protein
MRKGPTPEWDIVELALLGALVGMVVGGVFCCFLMLVSSTHGADHFVRDPVIGAVVGVLLLSAYALIRNRIRGVRNV